MRTYHARLDVGDRSTAALDAYGDVFGCALRSLHPADFGHGDDSGRPALMQVKINGRWWGPPIGTKPL